MFLKKIFKKKKIVETVDLCKEEDFDFDLINYYFRNKNRSDTFQIINNQFIADVDFYDLFMFLDRTNSKPGQQYLFDKLLTINSKIDFEEQEQIIDYFQKNKKAKEKAQALLSKLNKRESYYISNLFLDKYTSRPKWFWVIRMLSILGILALVIALIFQKVFVFPLLAVYIINTIFHFWNKRNIMAYMDSIPLLLLICRIANELIKLNFTSGSNNILSSVKSINELKRRIFFFKFERKADSEIEAVILFVTEIVKILFLIEPLIVFNVLKELDRKRNDIQTLFEYIGNIDSALSVAAVRMEMPYCKPTIVNDKTSLEFTEIYHPLIVDCIANSLKITNKSILLTGSNMSGKTTFIRTVGINVLLAQTINTCFAKSFNLPQMRVFSAIRISDDLLNDKSYYFEEVSIIKNLIDESDSSVTNLFLLDEIFKGTNTIERLSAGKAVLSYLVKSDNNVVFVSTHDMEFTELLSDTYDLYHFTELIQNDDIYFDYKLKSGAIYTTNAIRILEINKYPKKIIEEAQKTSRLLRDKLS
jgi:DNA mismatch repair ATPase MutS